LWLAEDWKNWTLVFAMFCSISDTGYSEDEDNLTLYSVFCISLFISFVLILEGIWLSLNSWNKISILYS